MASNSGWRIIILAAIAALAIAADDPSLAAHRTYGPWHSAVIGGGGFLQHLVWAPADPRRAYLSSDVGGCWRSDDGGTTWRMLLTDMPSEPQSYAVRGLVVDPRRSDTVLIAVDSGVWRSQDGGRTWARTLTAAWRGNGKHRGAGRILVIDQFDPDRIYAAAIGSGFHTSVDRGLTWIRSGPEGLYPVALLQDTTNSERLWLSSLPARVDGVSFAGGLHMSSDRGQTWESICTQGVAEMVQRCDRPDTLIALTADAARVASSDDRGRSWRQCDEGLAPPSDDVRSDGTYGALTATPDAVLLGGNGGSFYRLATGNEGWEQIDWRREDVDEQGWWGALDASRTRHFGSCLSWLTVHPTDPHHWAFTDWYALYQSTTAGSTWKLTIDGVEMAVVHVVVQDPGNPSRVHVGAADIGYFRSLDHGSTFKQISSGISNNIKHIAVSASDPQRLYAVGPQTWEWEANQVFCSSDGGSSWRRPAMRGLGNMSSRRCNTVTVHPSNRDECYLVLDGPVQPDGGGVWRSTDAGESWIWIGQGLPAIAHCFRHDIWVAGPEVAVSADGSLVACSDDTGRVFRRVSDTWQELPFGSDTGGANAIVADPGQTGRFWLCRKEGGLWRSDDQGTSWLRATTLDAWSVALDVRNPQLVAINGRRGVHLSRDAGATWTNVDATLPNRQLRNLVAFAGDRLIVGSGGNGIFWCAVKDVPRKAQASGDGRIVRLVSGLKAP